MPGGQELAPTTAQHAIREGHCVADNIAAVFERRSLRAFSYKGVGHLAALGRRSAVAEFMGIRLSGLAAWWLWRTVYLAKLPGIDRKLRVATDWTLDLLLKQDIVQLKTERTPAITHEHFDTGEAVVREGDVGDKLYVIKSGRVEVMRPDPDGEERRVAELGPGDYFGEIALMDTGGRRNATVRALTPLDVLAVGRPEFLALMASFPDLRSLFEDLARERGR
jgi:NADH dehydrogenase